MDTNLIIKQNYVHELLVMLVKYTWRLPKNVNVLQVLLINSTKHVINVPKIITSTIINVWLAKMEQITISQQKNVTAMKLLDTSIRVSTFLAASNVIIHATLIISSSHANHAPKAWFSILPPRNVKFVHNCILISMEKIVTPVREKNFGTKLTKNAKIASKELSMTLNQINVFVNQNHSI